ncbi:hypothetical protein BD410DRAFT_693617, partial [Rickenella mellea]
KPIPPFIYKGEARFDVFQRWLYELMEYFKTSHIRASRRVPRLKHFLGGRANIFFMREVAQTPKDWTLDKFLSKLFDHCFPANFRTEQRLKLNDATQRGRTVREWVLELRNLADCVGDVSERQLVLHFWKGSDSYICERW